MCVFLIQRLKSLCVCQKSHSGCSWNQAQRNIFFFLRQMSHHHDGWSRSMAHDTRLILSWRCGWLPTSVGNQAFPAVQYMSLTHNHVSSCPRRPPEGIYLNAGESAGQRARTPFHMAPGVGTHGPAVPRLPVRKASTFKLRRTRNGSTIITKRILRVVPFISWCIDISTV